VDFGLATPQAQNARTLKDIRDEAEKDAVLRVLSRVNGNMSRAADLLGVSRPTLYDLLNRFGLKETHR
jgi:two-component system NtrC family response regulator